MKQVVALISSSVLLNTVPDRVHLQFRMPCGTFGTTGIVENIPYIYNTKICFNFFKKIS